MTEDLKLRLLKKKISNVPTKDVFGQDVEIGDIVLTPQNSGFVPGKVVSLCDRSIEITCTRDYRKRQKWNRQTASYVAKDSSYVVIPVHYTDRFKGDYLQKHLAAHNGTKRIYLWSSRSNGECLPGIINLTKLNLIHEDSQN